MSHDIEAGTRYITIGSARPTAGTTLVELTESGQRRGGVNK